MPNYKRIEVGGHLGCDITFHNEKFAFGSVGVNLKGKECEITQFIKFHIIGEEKVSEARNLCLKKGDGVIIKGQSEPNKYKSREGTIKEEEILKVFKSNYADSPSGFITKWQPKQKVLSNTIDKLKKEEEEDEIPF